MGRLRAIQRDWHCCHDPISRGQRGLTPSFEFAFRRRSLVIAALQITHLTCVFSFYFRSRGNARIG